MNKRLVLLGAVIILIVASIAYLESQKVDTNISGADATISLEHTSMDAEKKAKQFDTAKEITTPDGFINTDAITVEELIGKKVILVDFWTYSCINCQRTLPYLNAWYDEYRDQGLEILAIHTPEFEFEKDYDNVQRAVDKFGIEYPVILDNDYSTWQAYKNRYWPRKYLIDIDGFIVYDHIGEGGYDETEREIQKALAERMAKMGESGEISSGITVPDNVEVSVARSPETYFGSLRNRNFGNGTQGLPGVQALTLPTKLDKDTLYLSGEWNITPEYAEAVSEGAGISFVYEAKNVFLVASSEKPIRIKVMLDGKPIGDMAGLHVDSDGYVTIQAEQLYRLVEDPSGLGSHTLELLPEDSGLQAFAFTFG